MYSYIARRLAFGALTVIGVSIMVFVVMRILPGDPLVAIFGPEGMTKLTEEQRASYMAELGLSDPLWVQYLRWVKDILRGNFGHSFFRSESVADMILRRGPLTAEIALISVVLSWLVGIPGGHHQRAQAQHRDRQRCRASSASCSSPCPASGSAC